MLEALRAVPRGLVGKDEERQEAGSLTPNPFPHFLVHLCDAQSDLLKLYL